MLDFKFSYFFFYTEIRDTHILVFYIFSYLLLLNIIFLLCFFFNFSNVSTLINWRVLSAYNFFNILILTVLLSLSGMPPLLGFIYKFLLFLIITEKNFFLFLLYFLLINIILTYFYLQNTRFLIKNFSQTFHFNNYINSIFFKYLNYLIILNFFNIFSFLLIDNLLIVFFYLTNI